MNLNEMRDKAHQTSKNKGWHDPEVDASFGDRIALMHSELSEALEEYRNGHGPNETYYNKSVMSLRYQQKPEGIPIELADVIIRIGDFCGKYEIDIEEAVKLKMDYNDTRPHRHGGKKL